jgi:carboxyl-terminal processing protease
MSGKGRDEKAMILRDKDRNILYSGPLAVMVDEGSASASEIFAAAIQDYKRGVIIGSTSTYGKGTVQRTIPLSPEAENNLFQNAKTEDLGSVKLTLQKFYRVNGGATQLKGVTPDIVIPDRYENYKFREKDNASSLSWDEISQADYKPWISSVSTDLVSKTFTDQIAQSPVFSKVKEDAALLSKLNDKEYSLNIVKYKGGIKRT